MPIRTPMRAAVAAAALAAALAGQAQAQTEAQSTAGTAAGTVISNTAQASYTVNGTPQTTRSNESRFLVDRKVNLTVVKAQPANTQVNHGEVDAVTTFRVTNTTNGTQDILLDPDQNILGILNLGTDDFDMTGLKAYVDANGNDAYDPGVDVATYIDELPADQSRTVFLVGDVPDAAAARLAIVNLHATVAEGGAPGTRGAALLPSAINTDAEIDVVFVDADSDGGGRDLARDGQARAYVAYEVGTHDVALTVTKSSRVVSDGVDALTPRALPGAVVEYCLAVRNATLGTAAANVTLTDLIPANTTYVAGSIAVGGVGGTCALGGQPQDDDDDDANDGGAYRASFDAAAKKVTAVIPTLAGGATLNASFRVTID